MSRHTDLYSYSLNHPKLQKTLPEGMPYKCTKKPYISATNIHKRALHMRISALLIIGRHAPINRYLLQNIVSFIGLFCKRDIIFRICIG